MSTLYRRTPKGQAEFGQRSRELLPRLRSTLILVDGKRDVLAISAVLLQAGDVTQAALSALHEQGFIEPAPGAPVAAAATPPPANAPITRPAPLPAAGAPAQSAAPASAAPFVALQRAAVQALNEALGPAAQTLAIRMERCRSLEELRPLLDTATQLVGTARGSTAAASFAARLQGLV
jgi:DNA-binding transcriptional MocR family regulator